jgi:IclR family acetate operon transcriptional repressor
MRNAAGEPRDPYLLGSLRKGLEVLDCFSRRESWSLAELAAVLGQSKPTIFRALHTLVEFGYLEKHAVTGRYTPGRRLRAFGSAAASPPELLSWQALAPLQDLARDTGETVHAGVLYGGEAVCVQAVDGTRLVRMHAVVGKRTPAHASALGKVLLAQLSGAERDAFLACRKLPAFTPRTITSAPALRAELHRIREQGWALDDEEFELGLRCLGAPIADLRGRSVASIAVSAPAARMDPARIRELVPLVRAAADRIAGVLAGREVGAAADRAA